MKKLLISMALGTATACSGEWYIEAGPWTRGGMGVEVQGGSRAAQEGAQTARPGTAGGRADVPVQAVGDDGTGQVLREFDDGYVGPSGVQWARELGVSQYYGYQNDGQYDEAAGSLSFTRQSTVSSMERRTVTVLESGAAGWSGQQDMEGFGALLTLGYVLPAGKQQAWSLQAQLGWLEGMKASFSGREAWSQEAFWTTYESRMDRSQTWTYTYDTLGNPAFPPARYTMTDPSGTGPLIADRPTTIQQTAGSLEASDVVARRGREVAISRVDLDVEMQALSLSLGPQVKWTLLDRVSVILQGGVTMNLLDANLSRKEIFARDDGTVLGSWSNSRSDQKWLPGASVSAGLQYNISDRIYIQAAGGYDWVKSTDLSIGPDLVEINLSGVRGDCAVGWRL